MSNQDTKKSTDNQKPSELSELPCSASWTQWPTYTGQQFIHHAGKTWVGDIEQIVRDDDTKLIVWKGSAYYTLWASGYAGGFWFQQITWPKSPQNAEVSQERPQGSNCGN